MKKRIVCVLLLLSIPCLAGCWDQTELTERAFVMGAAIDLAEGDEQLLLTVQFIKPSQKEGEQRQQAAFINTSEFASDLFGASRNLVQQLGRKPNWSHMQILLISEDVAKSLPLDQLLDFFIRDLETRSSTRLAIVEGRAIEYLSIQPKFELTVGRQLRMNISQTALQSAKTAEKRIFDFYLESSMEVGHTVLPYLSLRGEKDDSVVADGVAVMKEGRMTHRLTGEETQMILLIMGKYDSGAIQIEPYSSDQVERSEVIEVGFYDSRLSVDVSGNGKIRAGLELKLSVSISELVQTKIASAADQEAYAKHIEAIIKRKIEQLFSRLQNEQADLLQLGDRLYRYHPQVWGKLKEDWEEHYQQAQLDVKVDVEIISSGLTGSEPIGSN